MMRGEIDALTDHQADEIVARKILGYAGPSPCFIRASSDLNVGFRAVDKIGKRIDSDDSIAFFFELMYGVRWHARWVSIAGHELYAGHADRPERAVVNAVILAHRQRGVGHG